MQATYYLKQAEVDYVGHGGRRRQVRNDHVESIEIGRYVLRLLRTLWPW